jgi:hypothetical protein
MEIYKDLSGQSNASRYEIGQDYITVEFKTRGKDGCNTYKYTYMSAGEANIEHMKKLAVAGLGLNSFINTQVKKRYECKW